MLPLILLYTIVSLTGFILVIGFLKSIRIVPTQKALVIERLGKYRKTLGAGFHLFLCRQDRQLYL